MCCNETAHSFVQGIGNVSERDLRPHSTRHFILLASKEISMGIVLHVYKKTVCQIIHTTS